MRLTGALPPAQPPPGTPPGLTVAQLVDGWIQNNQAAIAHTCDVLLSFTTPQMQAQRAALIAYVQTQLVPRVTAASVDPRLPQRSLSERLANVGVLPMFGFPTRVRYLFHERPGGAYEWPPDGVVDRELDIAISQFAPSSETVKDGVIHTAVGVVDYQPQGNAVVEQPNPLGPPLPIGLCRRCQAVDGSQNPAQACPVCGAAPPDYEQVVLSQPRGFRTWFGASRDFDGVFEWTARASRPKVGVMPIGMTPSRELRDLEWPGHGLRHQRQRRPAVRLREARAGRDLGDARCAREGRREQSASCSGRCRQTGVRSPR